MGALLVLVALCPAALASVELSLAPVIGFDRAAQAMPMLQRVGNDVLAVWQEQSGSGTALKARLIRHGQPFGVPIHLATRPGFHPPALACGNTTCLVVWHIERGLQSWRISADGTLLDSTPLPIAPNGSLPAVAATVTGFIVIWPDATGVSSRVVNVDGRLSEPRSLVLPRPSVNRGTSGTSEGQENFAIACAATVCLAVWEHQFRSYAISAGGIDRRELRGSLISSEGMFQSAGNLILGVDLRNPRVAATERDFLIAAFSDRSHRVIASFADENGTLLSTLTLPGGYAGYDIATDEDRYYVVTAEFPAISWITTLTAGGSTPVGLGTNYSVGASAIAIDGGSRLVAAGVETRTDPRFSRAPRIMLYGGDDFRPGRRRALAR
jgi:hypothetical protein